jgi:hypothetical protein
MPRSLAAALVRQAAQEGVAPPPGYQVGSPAQLKQAWPGSTGAGVPGMAGEPLAQHVPGGNLVGQVLHQGASPIERFFNKLPEEGWFAAQVSPSRPVQVDLGSFTSPNGQSFWLFDYEFQVFVQSGVDPGDVKPAETGRFFGVLGFDITFNGSRLANLRYEIDPGPSVFTKSGFQQGGTPGNPLGVRLPPPSAFALATANSFAAAGPGLSLLPVWDKLYGPRQGPFSVQVQEGATVTLSAFIFHPLPAPIASISGRLAGFLIGSNVSNTLVNRVRLR